MSTSIAELTGLKKAYGHFRVIDDVTMELNSGEIIVLSGPNGSGKTTLIRMICGLELADSGTIRIQGVINPGQRSDVRKKIGYCPQKPVVWNTLTPGEQLRFIGKLYGMKPQTVDLAVKGLVDEFKLEGIIDKRTNQLSAGNRQLINLLLSLVHQPLIILLDEPTVSLDSPTRDRVLRYLRFLVKNRARTLLLVTHQVEEAEEIADKYLTLEAGRLV